MEIFKEFLPSGKKYCWKTSRDEMLKFLDILIGNTSFRQFITQLYYVKKQNTLIIFKNGIQSNFITIPFDIFQIWLNIALMLLWCYLP